jgi:hypothetical protein
LGGRTLCIALSAKDLLNCFKLLHRDKHVLMINRLLLNCACVLPCVLLGSTGKHYQLWILTSLGGVCFAAHGRSAHRNLEDRRLQVDTLKVLNVYRGLKLLRKASDNLVVVVRIELQPFPV